MKAMLKKIVGQKLYEKFLNLYLVINNKRALQKNYDYDKKQYIKHSRVFDHATFEKVESMIIMAYHSLEKGFLFDEVKYKFGKPKVERLLHFLKQPQIIGKCKETQIQAAYIAMIQYYEIHKEANVDISNMYSETTYLQFKSLLLDFNLHKKGVLYNTKESFFEAANDSFLNFSKSRKSVRDFSKEKIPMETIYKVIELARHAPSVCNRQATKVYYTEDVNKIEAIFDLQGGFRGYSQNVCQLLFITVDRSYFYTVGERNQFYVDGGIFLMNLMYSVHHYGIAACPANWGMTYEKDIKAAKIFGIPESEKIICLLPIGIPKESFKTTLSLRRDVDEILKIV